MPTIFELDGFEFVMFFNDHAPGHIHVFKVGTQASFYLDDEVTLRENKGMKAKDRSKARKIILENLTFFRSEWKRIRNLSKN